jgi:hypothetical protein
MNADDLPETLYSFPEWLEGEAEKAEEDQSVDEEQFTTTDSEGRSVVCVWSTRDEAMASSMFA